VTVATTWSIYDCLQVHEALDVELGIQYIIHQHIEDRLRSVK